MFVITLQVAPQPGTAQAREVGGAYAVCWIDFSLQDGAEQLAKFYVEQAGWTAPLVKKVGRVDEAYYAQEQHAQDGQKQYFEEAQADGVSIIFYEWPPGATPPEA